MSHPNDDYVWHGDDNEKCSSDSVLGKSTLLNWSLLEDPDVLEDCRTSLREHGAAVVKNLATPEGLEKLRSEVLSAPYNESKQHYTPWQDQGDPVKYPESHPRNFRTHSSAAFVGRKTLEEATTDGLCISVYNETKEEGRGDVGFGANRLLRFLSRVADERLYQSEDENGSVYCYRIHSEHNPPWHFDESPYTAILYLQNPEGGGDFEYVPWCRPTTSKDDPAGHEIVRRLVMETTLPNPLGTPGADDPLVKRIPIQPGSLLFFNGAKSFHRAAPTTGSAPRVGLVFTFGLAEGFENSQDVRSSNEWDPRDSTHLVSGE